MMKKMRTVLFACVPETAVNLSIVSHLRGPLLTL
ncbi:ORF2 [Barthadenovirus mellis]|uniref:ORF2 n=1 Tax=Passerine adenovirus 1 TaxID=2779174 RepID=A0A7L9DK95_9ADEN|nr:ORF2 [Passerine adenovirus 1]